MARLSLSALSRNIFLPALLLRWRTLTPRKLNTRREGFPLMRLTGEPMLHSPALERPVGLQPGLDIETGLRRQRPITIRFKRTLIGLHESNETASGKLGTLHV